MVRGHEVSDKASCSPYRWTAPTAAAGFSLISDIRARRLYARWSAALFAASPQAILKKLAPWAFGGAQPKRAHMLVFQQVVLVKVARAV